MVKRRKESGKGHQLVSKGLDAANEAQAEKTGAKFDWHFGRVIRMGNFEPAGGRGVTIAWDEGGVTSQQGSLTNEQWEIFRLAFQTTGRLAVLSDEEGERWMHDYRFIEALR